MKIECLNLKFDENPFYGNWSSTPALPASTPTRPQLDKGPLIDEKELEQGQSQLADFVGDGFNLEFLAQKVLSELSDYSTRHLEIQHGFFELEKAWIERVEKERGESIRSHNEATASQESWGKVTKALASFGLIATGIANVATLGVPLAVATVVVGGCLVLDQLLGDKGKKQIALWLQKANNESQEVWVNRIHLFFGICSCALSLGLSQAAAVQIAMNISTAAATGAKGIVDYRVSRHKATLIELDAICRESRTNIDVILSSIQDTCAEIQRFHSTNHDLDEKLIDATHILLRPIDL